MNIISRHIRYISLSFVLFLCNVSFAQETTIEADTLAIKTEEVIAEVDSVLSSKETKRTLKKAKRNWATWHPEPKRAMWLAIVIPGAGQIYNGKYWKLPIVYGGFVGCAYAMRWNDQMFKDYSQAYLDIMDDDDTTKSYESFLHLGAKIDSSNKERYQNIFKSRKDRYRRWRDLSFFCMLGVYAISIIDAYVDASLSQFDISDDLSLRVEPGFVSNSHSAGMAKGNSGILKGNTGFGINCSLSF